MKKVHSFLGGFKDRYKHLGLGRYRAAYVITAYSLVAVTLILSAEHYFSEDTTSIQVQAKTNFESSGLKEVADVNVMLHNEENRTVYTTEDKVLQYFELGTLDGMTSVAVEKLAKLQQQEDAIDLVMKEQEVIKTNIAREVAEEERQLAVAKAEEAARIEAAAKKKAEELLKQQAANKTAISMNESERTTLERIVQAESGNQDIKGKILVANVVLNRVKSSRFPNTIKGVVYQHSGSSYQFQPAKSGSIYRVKVSQETKQAVTRALNGEDYSKGALFFVARSAANKNNLSWFDRALTRLFTHGGHTFYK